MLQRAASFRIASGPVVRLFDLVIDITLPSLGPSPVSASFTSFESAGILLLTGPDTEGRRALSNCLRALQFTSLLVALF